MLNDQTTCRVIELCKQQYGDPGIPFTWLCFGSEARGEQTLHTDQDNGILFEADNDAQARQMRQRLLPLARHINEMLAECGFTLCTGQIMASNPELCLSRHEWQKRFTQYPFCHPGKPAGVIHLLDFRAVWRHAGREALSTGSFNWSPMRLTSSACWRATP